ncbi:MAG: ATP-binding protein, partial [Pseudomonadota bacterium]
AQAIVQPGAALEMGNLIDNAVDFSRTKVVIDLAWDDETVALSIRDDGPGFPPGLLSKLGEPFVTARSAKRRAKRPGMGLGLFISKTLLARSGAEVRFENHLGEKGRVAGALVSIVWRRSDLSGNA